jgi:UDP-N-acetyl-D-mannosaminuronate dehydrogenase
MVNLEMPNYIVSRLAADHGGNLKSKKVLIIGVSYKSDIADVRETPAANLIIQLKEMGAKVSWHDDVVKNWEDETSTDPKNFDIAILVTRHSYISNEVILNSAEYVFDCTGSCDGAIQL